LVWDYQIDLLFVLLQKDRDHVPAEVLVLESGVAG
jgi:hypothetical protein